MASFSCQPPPFSFDVEVSRDADEPIAAGESRIQIGRAVFADGVPSGKGLRTCKQKLRFSRAFAGECRVVCGFVALNLGGDNDARFSALPKSVTKEGFELNLHAWDEGTIESAEIVYLAFDEQFLAKDGVDGFRLVSGVAKYGKDMPAYSLSLGSGRRVASRSIELDSGAGDFHEKPFIVTPLLGAAVNSTEADVRLAGDVRSVTLKKAHVELSTWSDTHIVSGMLMFLALGPARKKPVALKAKSKKKSASSSSAATSSAAATSAAADDGSASSDDFEKPSKKKAKVGAVSAASVAADDSDNNQCVVCFDAEINSVFVPCGHQCCCVTCANHLAGPKTKKECPIW